MPLLHIHTPYFYSRFRCCRFPSSGESASLASSSSGADGEARKSSDTHPTPPSPPHRRWRHHGDEIQLGATKSLLRRAQGGAASQQILQSRTRGQLRIRSVGRIHCESWVLRQMDVLVGDSKNGNTDGFVCFYGCRESVQPADCLDG